MINNNYQALPSHLDKINLINKGAFYTSPIYVDTVWDFIEPYIDKETVVFDPACGYGVFLSKETKAKKIGNDIDSKALEIAKNNTKDVAYYNYNFLEVFNRTAYGIDEEKKLIVIGNPPYNDITSQAKKRLKKLNFGVNEKLKTRDIGISFLRAFDYLKADYICVLHPLSYLIKKANFNLLKNFRENYIIVDSLIISSKYFNQTSKSSEFPIVIALYKRKENNGMDYEYIKNFNFKTIEGKTFKLSDFEYIGDFINKYPKKNIKIKEGDILFYTLRDINALKRNKTFIEKPIANAVKVDIDKLDYYIYVDIFKDFIRHVPYYFGNLDILIDTQLFRRYKDYFISYALKKYPFLKKHYSNSKIHPKDETFILKYFKELLKGHFIPIKEKK
ncbi:Eco57I restriction-modification methylase domain-containing protein [Persephonella sp.]|uniref:Eco57I restriction-modification methylase domain-containing protein n=1 Tax=Persephonella sp. TaxID=2060922 RepID=UPI002623412C|nr:Eco57I restriction-modification methylase domain-containing protein [Persephonella sp.]